VQACSLDIGSGRVFVLSHVAGSLRLPQPRLLTWCDRCMPVGPVLYGQHCGAGVAGQVGAGWSAATVGLTICCWSDNSCWGCFATKEHWFHGVLAGVLSRARRGAAGQQGSLRVGQSPGVAAAGAALSASYGPMSRSFYHDLAGAPSCSMRARRACRCAISDARDGNCCLTGTTNIKRLYGVHLHTQACQWLQSYQVERHSDLHGCYTSIALP
jgi:hypothetical protein